MDVLLRLELVTAYTYALNHCHGSTSGNADFLCRLPSSASECDRDVPSRFTPSDEERVSVVHSNCLLLGGPSAVWVGSSGLAPSDSSSDLGGLPLSPHDSRLLRQHGPRMRVDDVDSLSREFVAGAQIYFSSRGSNWDFPANTCACDSLAASVFAVPVAPLPASAEGTDFGHRATSSDPFPPQTDGNAPTFSSVVVPVSSTVALDKAAWESITSALSVYHNSAEHPTDSSF